MRVHMMTPEEESRIIKDALDSQPRCGEPECRNPSQTVLLSPAGDVFFVGCRECAKPHAVHDSLVMKVRS